MSRIGWMAVAVVVVIVAVIVGIAVTRDREPDVIKIGAILVLTGPDAKAGRSARAGIEMAAAEVNASGGANGRRVEVVYEDDQGLPDKAVSAAKKLLTVDKVVAVIGPMWSSPMLAVAPIAERHHTVFLSPTASSPKITGAGDYVFRNTYSDALEGAKTAEYAYKKLGYRRAALLYINNDFGQGLASAFSRAFGAAGGAVVADVPYQPGSNDFRTYLSKAQAANPDVIYLAGYSEMGTALRQAKELGVGARFLSCIMFEISAVLENAGAAADGVDYAFVSYDPSKGGQKTKAFAAKFRRQYGELPDPEAAFAYDAAWLLVEALRSGCRSSDDIKLFLYGVQGYEGVTGGISFDKHGDVVKPIGFKRVEQGKYVWKQFVY